MRRLRLEDRWVVKMSKPKTDSKVPKISEGYIVGKLTVKERTPEKKNGYSFWRCECECGGEICLDTRTLQRRTVKDCGCETVVKPGQKDLTGIRFGKLICIEPTYERGSHGGTIWKCQCDCGNSCLAVSTQLTHGYKKSCGCLSHPPLKDFIGKCFHMLKVIGYAGKRDGMHYWLCRCDCGNETIVGQTLLQTGKTKSCGCLQKKQIYENLKLSDGTSVTILEASKRRLLKSNKSGYTGVYQGPDGKWIAQITFKRKTYHLGIFKDIQDAVRARKRGEEMHDEFLKWYYSNIDKSKRKLEND